LVKSTQSIQITIPVQYEPIIKLLLELPSQWVIVVEQFMRFLVQNHTELFPEQLIVKNNKDIEIINQRAEYLNKETADALTYQVSL
jgi:hypothetical protein